MSGTGSFLGAGALLFLILLYLAIFVTVWAFKPSRVLNKDGCVDLGKVASWSLVPLVLLIVLGIVAGSLGADAYVSYQENGNEVLPRGGIATKKTVVQQRV